MKYWIGCLLFLLIGCGDRESRSTYTYNEGLHVIPQPKEMKLQSGEFTLKRGTSIGSTRPAEKYLCDSLAARIKGSSGARVRLADQGESADILLQYDDTMRSDAYRIRIFPDSVRITASSDAGMYYAVQSFLQLFPAEIESRQGSHPKEYRLPCVEVYDYPSLKYRGVLIDVCRHFFSVEEIKKQIRIMGMLKLNKLHLHLTDNQAWRIEIRKYPELIQNSAVAETYNGSKYGPFYYTQEDLKEIIAYAAQHQVEVIPEIEFPGHSLSALVAFPELSCSGGPFVSEQVFGFEENVFCVGNEKVYGFMQNVLSEVVELFPSEYIHIGGDECSKKHWDQCPKCQAKARELGLVPTPEHSVGEQLQSYAIERIQRFVSTELGKKMIGWHEVLEGGIDKQVTIMSWRDPNIGLAAAQAGYHVILAPMPAGFYLCDYQGGIEVEPAASGERAYLRDLYTYRPIPEGLPDEARRRIDGLEACAWSEWCPDVEHLETLLYPRLVALAENAWCDEGQKNWTDFLRRLDNMQVRLLYNGVRFHIPMPEGIPTQNVVFRDDSVVLELTNSRGMPMVYTLDGSEPTVQSDSLPARLVLRQSGVLKVATVASGFILGPTRTIEIERQEKPIAACRTDCPRQIRLQIADGVFASEQDYARAVFRTDTMISALQDYDQTRFDFRNPSLAVYSGYLEVPQTRIYTFESNSDELWVAGRRLVYNPTSSRFRAQKRQIYLEQGVHPFKLVFSNRLKEGFASCWYDFGYSYQ